MAGWWQKYAKMLAAEEKDVDDSIRMHQESPRKRRERESERERERERKKERKKEREGEEMLGKEMKCPKERKDLNKMSPCPTEKSKPSRDIVQELCEMIILSRYASVVL